MLDVRQLTSIRGERVLFENLSFSVGDGELVQIEGQNGAGKTTLLRIITGLGEADDGTISWNGVAIRTQRDDFHSDLLYLGHNTGVKRELTAFENLSFYCKMHQISADPDKLWHALACVGLAGREDIPAAQLSAGQNRRIALARLWITTAKIWVLDEPLTAIDKHGVNVLEKLFKNHVNNGGSVLFTTHQDMFESDKSLRKIKLGGE
ncbi:cytochrome c biogenesis heme-transporting ATPase CcmA [Veronia pacifica]|uniref:Heme ABC transporter ATP-binding protein CcmA n=1 Tax=Veronia pacifica TaxID=1080227 RepID=A0A1C3EEG5_9GAMM|nr:cytochrome c biogenesis heme-transporting ATPase CcmA [Veronia pacifica]ODA31628.1 heme ABC transporter ATP-binding protein CcmA [Veronia pacifica]